MSTTNKKSIILSIALKFISLFASIYGLIFTIDNIMSFTFFTTLSNVALDIILVIFIVLDIILLKTGRDYKNNKLYILKFLMTLSITLTFLVYMLILGPTSKDGLSVHIYIIMLEASVFILQDHCLQLLIFLYLIKVSSQKIYMQYMPSSHLFAMWGSYICCL